MCAAIGSKSMRRYASLLSTRTAGLFFVEFNSTELLLRASCDGTACSSIVLSTGTAVHSGSVRSTLIPSATYDQHTRAWEWRSAGDGVMRGEERNQRKTRLFCATAADNDGGTIRCGRKINQGDKESTCVRNSSSVFSFT